MSGVPAEVIRGYPIHPHGTGVSSDFETLDVGVGR